MTCANGYEKEGGGEGQRNCKQCKQIDGEDQPGVAQDWVMSRGSEPPFAGGAVNLRPRTPPFSLFLSVALATPLLRRNSTERKLPALAAACTGVSSRNCTGEQQEQHVSTQTAGRR